MYYMLQEAGLIEWITKTVTELKGLLGYNFKEHEEMGVNDFLQNIQRNRLIDGGVNVDLSFCEKIPTMIGDVKMILSGDKVALLIDDNNVAEACGLLYK